MVLSAFCDSNGIVPVKKLPHVRFTYAKPTQLLHDGTDPVKELHDTSSRVSDVSEGLRVKDPAK